MKFSNEKIYHRGEVNPNLYNLYYNNLPKYNSLTSLKNNPKINYNLDPDEEYYLVKNKNNPSIQTKSVSFQSNKKIYLKNGVLSGDNIINLMNQFINYSMNKKKKKKITKTKKEENKKNKDNDKKNPQKQIYMEHLIKKGLMVDIQSLKNIKKKSHKDKLTQKKKDFLNELGIGYGSINSSEDNKKDDKDNDSNDNNNYYNYYREENEKSYYNTLTNLYTNNNRKIKFYSPNHNNINNINFNIHFHENMTSDKKTKKLKKPKINQFEYIHKIQKEINKIKTEPNNYMSVPANSPKSKIKTPKLVSTLNDSFRHNKNNKIKKRAYSNTNFNKRKEKKINLKKVGKKLMNLCIKTKDEYHLDERKTHRSPEELHFYIRNKKIMRKKNEVKKIDKKYRDLFTKFKNLYTLNNNVSPNNTNKGNYSKEIKHYTPNYYNTISILTSEFRNMNKKKKINTPKTLLGDEPKKNLNSTLIDADEYYLNVLESKKLIRNHIYNKTEFNFYRNKFQNEETESNKDENNIKNIIGLKKINNKDDNRDMIKKISKKIMDVLIKAKNVFSDNVNNNKNNEKENLNINEEKKINQDKNIQIKEVNVNILKDKNEEKNNQLKINKEPVKLIEEHNNKIQFLYENLKRSEDNIKDKNEDINREENKRMEDILIGKNNNIDEEEKIDYISKENKNNSNQQEMNKIENISKENNDILNLEKIDNIDKIENLINIERKNKDIKIENITDEKNNIINIEEKNKDVKIENNSRENNDIINIEEKNKEDKKEKIAKESNDNINIEEKNQEEKIENISDEIKINNIISIDVERKEEKIENVSKEKSNTINQEEEEKKEKNGKSNILKKDINDDINSVEKTEENILKKEVVTNMKIYNNIGNKNNNNINNNLPIINNYIKKNEDNKRKNKKELDPNKITKLDNVINKILKRYSFNILYKYYIQIVIVENYFIGIKYIIAICKKYAFAKLKRNLYNYQIFSALKSLINPFLNPILKEFFNILKLIPKKNNNIIEDIEDNESSEEIKNEIKNLDLNEVLLEEKNDNDKKNKDINENDILSGLCNNYQNNNNINEDNIDSNIIEQNEEINNIKKENNTNKFESNNININANEENSNIKISKEKNIFDELDIDKLSDEILQKILVSEITSKDLILIPKKKFKYKTKLKITKNNSSSNSTDNIIKDNKLLDINDLSHLSDENLSALNDTIMEIYTQKSYFFKTIIDKRKFYLIKFYQRKIAPKLIELIKNEIILKYDRIYNNICKPYGNNSKEIMISLILQDAEMLRDNFKVQEYKETISDIINKENLLKQFEPINKKIREQWQLKEKKKNNKLNESEEDYIMYDQYMNKCLIDCAIEIMNCERKYGENGDPLIWSSRTRELEFKYSKNDPIKLADFVSRNLFKFLKQKNGLICENYENLPGEIISNEREKRLINTIKSELEDGDYLWRNLEMEETQLKVEVSDCIVDQLYNEVIEIMEHIQLSRTRGELYHYRSIYACEEMPKLGFQTTTTENADNEENDNDNNILFNKV